MSGAHRNQGMEVIGVRPSVGRPRTEQIGEC